MRRLILLALLMSGSCVAYASYAYLSTPLDEIENPGAPVVQPTTTIPFNQQALPGDIALSADGKHLVYSESTEVLDIWAALVHFWPEYLIGLAGIIVVWRLVVSFRRRIKLSPENGPYCAKCYYPARGLDSVRCPECGNALDSSGITLGMTRERSLLINLLLVGFAGLIGVGYTLDLPRDIVVKHWLTWRSESLADSATQQKTIDFTDSIRYCTSLRSIPIDDPNNVKTICHVMNTADLDPWSGLIVLTFNGPRPNGFERIVSNTPQTHAGITTMDSYAVVDLETLKVSDDGQLNSGKGYTDLLSDDGASRVSVPWSNEKALTVDALDGTNDRVLPFVEGPIAELTIRLLSPDIFSSSDLSALGLNEQEPEAQQPVLLQEKVIKVLRRQSDAVSLYRAEEWPNSVRLQVMAEYVLLLGSQSVVVYDLAAKQWLAQLDLSTITAGVWNPDGTSIAVSADRSTVAVINNDGSQVAVYELPKPKQ